MDKKLTDSEIVKALECCCKGQLYQCNNCPLKGYSLCFDTLRKYTLDLINRFEAENEQLTKDKENLAYSLANAVGQKMTAKTEAYKEFAERLKTEYAKGMNWFKKKESYYVDVGDIDNLLKEMVGEDK